MLADKAESGIFMSMDISMDILYEFICSNRFLKSCRKEFFGLYNVPLLMGKEGDKLDGFVSQLSRDMSACRLEEFR